MNLGSPWSPYEEFIVKCLWKFFFTNTSSRMLCITILKICFGCSFVYIQIIYYFTHTYIYLLDFFTQKMLPNKDTSYFLFTFFKQIKQVEFGLMSQNFLFFWDQLDFTIDESQNKVLYNIGRRFYFCYFIYIVLFLKILI